MIRKFITSVVFDMTLMAQAQGFNLSEHYIEATRAVTKKPEVREFFSFYYPAFFR